MTMYFLNISWNLSWLKSGTFATYFETSILLTLEMCSDLEIMQWWHTLGCSSKMWDDISVNFYLMRKNPPFEVNFRKQLLNKKLSYLCYMLTITEFEKWAKRLTVRSTGLYRSCQTASFRSPWFGVSWGGSGAQRCAAGIARSGSSSCTRRSESRDTNLRPPCWRLLRCCGRSA